MERKEGPCPLGAKCEYVKDDFLYRCPWFVHIQGRNPQTGEMVDQHKCAIAWIPILLLDVGKNTTGVQASVESFRNEMVNQNANIGNFLLNGLKDESTKAIGVG